MILGCTNELYFFVKMYEQQLFVFKIATMYSFYEDVLRERNNLKFLFKCKWLSDYDFLNFINLCVKCISSLSLHLRSIQIWILSNNGIELLVLLLTLTLIVDWSHNSTAFVFKVQFTLFIKHDKCPDNQTTNTLCKVVIIQVSFHDMKILYFACMLPKLQ